jgi:cupin 2 domain-containing protein
MNLFDIRTITNHVGEAFEDVASIAGVRIERIVSTGQCSPPGAWYDQNHDEWVAVLQGEGVVGFEDGAETRLRAGDTLQLPAHLKHRVVWTSSEPPCIWLAVHGPAKGNR